MVQKKITDNLIAKNPKNEKIVKEFKRLIEQIKFDIDHVSRKESIAIYFRLKQITNALHIIAEYPKEIKSGEQLKDIKGIGKGTISRINEILKKGKLSEIKLKHKEKEYLSFIEELEHVIGVGRRTAHELVTKYNIVSIEQLKKAYDSGKIDLNDQILIGLKYYGIYQQQIPRIEIDKISDYLSTIIKGINKDLFHTICGSYRRKKQISNDVDILLTNPKVKTLTQFKKQENYLITLVKKLKQDNFILDDLTDKKYEIKYMGFCQLSEGSEKYPVRRIDIRYVPYESYPTALLYFTGSGEFNKKMRLIAQELGYKLNEYGLYKISDGKEIRIKDINSEEDIFNKLGLEYIIPEKRN